jgi:hypothetical protein
MAREKVVQSNDAKNQGFQLENLQNHGKMHQRQLLEQQITENAARKEVRLTGKLELLCD